MKGHLVRSRSLKNLNDNEKDQVKIKRDLIEKQNLKLDKNIRTRSRSPSVLRMTSPFSPDRIKNDRIHNQRFENYHEYNDKEKKFKNTRRNSNETNRNINKQFSQLKRNSPSKEVIVSSEDENRDLSEKEIQIKVDNNLQ